MLCLAVNNYTNTTYHIIIRIKFTSHTSHLVISTDLIVKQIDNFPFVCEKQNSFVNKYYRPLQGLFRCEMVNALKETVYLFFTTLINCIYTLYTYLHLIFYIKIRKLMDGIMHETFVEIFITILKFFGQITDCSNLGKLTVF